MILNNTQFSVKNDYSIFERLLDFINFVKLILIIFEKAGVAKRVLFKKQRLEDV